jgi:hypothetical protein
MLAVLLIAARRLTQPEESMSDDVEQFKQALGNALVAKDHEALDVLLAPWIRVSEALDPLREIAAAIAEEWDIDPTCWPTEFVADAGVLTFENLGPEIPDKVTADNYVGWHKLTFYPPEGVYEFDAYCDAWFAVVRLADGLHAGSLELVDPD